MARAHKKSIIKIKDLIQSMKSNLNTRKEVEFIKISAESILIKRMLRYSAMKRKANLVPPYSTLKPETNSDSPSAKSKGARLVSAKVVMNHKKTVGNIIRAMCMGACMKEASISVCIKSRGIRRINAMETS